MNDKVSVIIPTYNRFKSVLNTIESVKAQTHKNIEIIVVNDGSTDKQYYDHKWDDDIIVIHLEKNSKQVFGYPTVGYVINKGLEIYTGDYFATCDDDDCWLPNKLELQLKAMKETNCLMSCTEGYIGNGAYDKKTKYPFFNRQFFIRIIFKKYIKKGYNILLKGFPKLWDYNFVSVHNCIIACSVIIHKSVIDKIGKKLEIKMGGTKINGKEVHIDYEYWLRALKHTNCAYVDHPCVYYDNGHGDGKNY